MNYSITVQTMHVHVLCDVYEQLNTSMHVYSFRLAPEDVVQELGAVYLKKVPDVLLIFSKGYPLGYLKWVVISLASGGCRRY